MTDASTYRKHRFENNLQTLILVAGMIALLGLVGFTFGGFGWLFVFVIFAAISVCLAPKIGPAMLFKFYKGKPISPTNSPELYRILVELSKRAQLKRTPTLYYIPSKMHNAFAVGSGRTASIGVTHAILRDFTIRELTGILAHEMAHIRNKDTIVMGLADAMSRFATLMSRLGIFLCVVSLPLIIFGHSSPFSFLGILGLIAAPTIFSLLQLGLSRTREYAADADAALLTGDPDGLALALNRLATIHRSGWKNLIFPGRKLPEPSLLRTHPLTKDRIARLQELKNDVKKGVVDQLIASSDSNEVDPKVLEMLTTTFEPRTRIGLKRPAWHFMFGNWY